MHETFVNRARLRLCVIGAGAVGRTLAGAWRVAGHQVSVAVRDPADPKHADLRQELPLVQLGELPDADATLLAVPGPVLCDLVSAHAETLDGRLIVDATNNMGGAWLHQLSMLAERLPSSLVYRAFSTLGWESFRSEVAGEQPDLLYSGPHIPEREVMERLITDTGMRPVYVGDGAGSADLLDGAARLWWVLAFRRGFDHALALRLLEDDRGGGTGDANPPSTDEQPPNREKGIGRIAVIGAGKVGGTLGTAFVRAGHDVIVGVRNPAERAANQQLPEWVNVVDIADSLLDAEVVVLAVPGRAVADIVSAHADRFSGRLVVDATNNLDGDGPVNSHDVIVNEVDDARYGRAFNSLGVETLRQPYFGGVVTDMFFSTTENDRPVVADLIRTVGLRPVWLGPNRHGVADDVLRLWLAMAPGRGRHLGFRVLSVEHDKL